MHWSGQVRYQMKAFDVPDIMSGPIQCKKLKWVQAKAIYEAKKYENGEKFKYCSVVFFLSNGYKRSWKLYQKARNITLGAEIIEWDCKEEAAGNRRWLIMAVTLGQSVVSCGCCSCINDRSSHLTTASSTSPNGVKSWFHRQRVILIWSSDQRVTACIFYGRDAPSSMQIPAS